MTSSDPDPNLPRVLADWRLAPRRQPDFRTAVWARIAAARRDASWSTFVRAHAPVCAGALAIALLLGAWVGREQARTKVAADRDEIARAYVQSLDARAMQAP